MSEKLKPCPFCGRGEKTEIRVSRLSPTMRGPGAVISVAVSHWCERPLGVIAAYIEFRGRTEDDAIAAWNKRGEAMG
jgi:hypothetical protein